jgi:indole-3-glycerol phosphate synthase
VLRKDFVVDPYQIWEARAAGAAAVLLIVAALDDARLVALRREAHDAGLDTLVEVHDAAEAQRAGDAAGWRPLVVGVNARDLTTLQVDPDRFAAVREALPAGAVTVAESGVRGPADVEALRPLSPHAVLVGEHLVVAADPRAAVRALHAAGNPPLAKTAPTVRSTL